MQMISPTHYVFALEDPVSINHLVIFLTGQVALPEGTAAVIHYNTDLGIASGNEWIRLGHLTNNKASAIFRVGSGITSEARLLDIGISIEPFTDGGLIAWKAPNKDNNNVVKIVENLYNFVASFAQPAGSIDPASTAVVPLSTLNTWYTNMQRRPTL